MTLRIEKVEGKRALLEAFHLPHSLYKNDPYYVSPLWSDFKLLFDPKNPFYLHARADLFVAREGGRLVGSAAYIQDENFIRFHGEKTAHFGFFECANRPDVAAALFDRVEEEGRKAGMDRIIGPLNYSTNESCGLLVEGFDSIPYMMMPYNPPYYAELLEGRGYGKAKDLFAFIAPVNDAWIARLERISREAYAKGNITVRPVNLKHLADELKIVSSIYNSAWEKNWGFVPMTDPEMEFMAKRLKPVIIPDLLLIAFVDGNPAAFIMNLPNVNQVLKHIKGHLNPWALAKVLYHSRKVDMLRLLTMGVKAEYRKMGLDACLYYEGAKAGLRRKFKEVEFSWILEDNLIMQKAVRVMGGRKYKTYRVFQKSL